MLALSPGIVLAQVIFSDGFEGDGGGIVITPTTCAPRTPAAIDCGTIDTDGDGLPDCYETSIGTSPIFADSDGDEISDYDEIFTYFFDPDTNPYRFNPRIADVPSLNIEIANTPVIDLEYETSEGSQESISSEQSTGSSGQVTNHMGVSVSIGAEVTKTVKAGTESGFEGSVKGSIEVTGTLSRDTSRGWSETFSRAQSATQQEGVTYTGGQLRVLVKVKNAGNLAIRVESITLLAGQIDFKPFLDDDTEPFFRPIVELQSSFQPFELAGRGEETELLFSGELTLEKALELLRDSSNLQIQTAAFNITDPSQSVLNRSFTGAFNTIDGASAQVLVDYGAQRGYDKYYVTTLGNPQREISLLDALCDVLELEVGTTDDTLTRVIRDHPSQGAALFGEADPTFSRQWQVTTFSNPSGGVVTTYDPSEGYNLADISLRAAQGVVLTLIEDVDQDGLFERQEFALGSDPNADTDGDTLRDGFESLEGWMTNYPGEAPYMVYSNPVKRDADLDGFDDDEELANGTDPERKDFNPDRSLRTVSDFDGDGLTDLLLGAPGTDLSGFNQAGSAYVHQLFGDGQFLEVTAVNEGALSQPNALFGFSLATGYFNRDPYADAVISVLHETNDGVSNAGGVRVVFGSDTGLDSASAIKLSESSVWPTDPPNTAQINDEFGRALATGDFNDDGLDDIVIGVPGDNINGADAGRVYVLAGADGFEFDPGRALLIDDTPGEAGDNFGEWVSSGDFNGDGFDDLLIGSPGESGGGGINAGDLELVYGSADGLAMTDRVRIQQFQWDGQTLEDNDNFGRRFDIADFNQDGYDDAAIAAPGEDNGSGAVYLALGSASGLAPLAPAAGGLLLVRPSNRFGNTLTAGDFNADGCPDLAVAETESDLHLFYNTPDCQTQPILANLPALITHQAIESADADEVAAQGNEAFGFSIHSGDYNNDGIDDLLIQARLKDVYTDPNDMTSGNVDAVGRAYLLFGQDGPGLTLDEGTFRTLDHPIIGTSNAGNGQGYLFGVAPN